MCTYIYKIIDQGILLSDCWSVLWSFFIVNERLKYFFHHCTWEVCAKLSELHFVWLWRHVTQSSILVYCCFIPSQITQTFITYRKRGQLQKSIHVIFIWEYDDESVNWIRKTCTVIPSFKRVYKPQFERFQILTSLIKSLGMEDSTV